MARPLIKEIERLSLVLSYAHVLLSRIKKSTYKDEKRDARLRKKAGKKK